MLTPSNHHGMFLSERKNEAESFPDFLETKIPIPRKITKNEMMMIQSSAASCIKISFGTVTIVGQIKEFTTDFTKVAHLISTFFLTGKFNYKADKKISKSIFFPTFKKSMPKLWPPKKQEKPKPLPRSHREERETFHLERFPTPEKKQPLKLVWTSLI